MMGGDDRPVLWRVVYNGQRNRTGGAWDAGPWHPDRGRVEHFAAWLRSMGHRAEVQNNGTPASRV